MSDVDYMRYAISNAYAGRGWKIKVSKMPENQVMAIYFRMQRDLPQERERKCLLKMQR